MTNAPDELTALRADVARLTAERDDLRTALADVVRGRGEAEARAVTAEQRARDMDGYACQAGSVRDQAVQLHGDTKDALDRARGWARVWKDYAKRSHGANAVMLDMLNAACAQEHAARKDADALAAGARALATEWLAYSRRAIDDKASIVYDECAEELQALLAGRGEG